MYESFSSQDSNIISNMKSNITSDSSSFSLEYNLRDDILIQNANAKIKISIPTVGKLVYLAGRCQDIDPFSCFVLVCPTQLFLSFQQRLIEGLGSKYFKDAKFYFTLADIIIFLVQDNHHVIQDIGCFIG